LAEFLASFWRVSSGRVRAPERRNATPRHPFGVHLIEDPVEARRRIEEFLNRAARRDAYGELLATGQVSRKLSDRDAREALRSDLRRQARADKLKIITRAYDELVIALLDRPISNEMEARVLRSAHDALEAAAHAKALGHQPRVIAREHTEYLAHCIACDAVGHVDASSNEMALSGALYCDRCR